MQSLHTKLDPIKDRVLRITELVGQLAAMREFDVKGINYFRDWLEEVTGDRDFGINPKLGSNGSQGILDKVATKVVHKLLELQVENRELRIELRALKSMYSHNDGSDTEQALALMEVCQV